MKKHIPFTETVRQIAAGSWGTRSENDEDAQKKLIAEKVSLEGACLLSIVQKIDLFVQAITKEEIKRQIDALESCLSQRINNFIENRERTHGPCPHLVRDYLYSAGYESVSSQMFYLGCLPNGNELWFRPKPPPTKTKERREYDKWMRRKPPKQETDNNHKPKPTFIR